MDLGAWLVELLSSPDPTCLLGRDHGQGLLPGRRNQSQHGASSNISLTPSTQGGQRKQGHTHRRGLETCELNLVNSPGAVHSVPSWGRKKGHVRALGTSRHEAQMSPGYRSVSSTSIRHCIMLQKVFGQEDTPGALSQGLPVPS